MRASARGTGFLVLVVTSAAWAVDRSWLTIAGGSDYEPVFARIREVLTRVGRMKFLRPLFAALGKHARTQQLGREIYHAAKDTYHSLSRRVIESTMERWPAA